MSGAYLATGDGDRHLIEDAYVIGRAPNASLTIAVPNMSRIHAQITWRSGSWWLEDLASKNGTFVNGRNISGPAVRLATGDEIVFGGAVSFTFHDPAATPIAPRIGRLDGVWIDATSGAVWVDAVRIEPPLSPRQLALLQLLDQHRGDVVARTAIVEQVWADAAAEGVSDDAVGALVKRLRARLREGPRGREYVEVVRGRGVRLK